MSLRNARCNDKEDNRSVFSAQKSLYATTFIYYIIIHIYYIK